MQSLEIYGLSIDHTAEIVEKFNHDDRVTVVIEFDEATNFNVTIKNDLPNAAIEVYHHHEDEFIPDCYSITLAGDDKHPITEENWAPYSILIPSADVRYIKL